MTKPTPLTPAAEAELTAEAVRSFLNYDPQTGFFTYKVRRGTTVAGSIASRRPGSSGYISIRINGRLYGAHRLAWLHFYGQWPTGWIDHIDRDPTNNTIANLRDGTPSENQANTPKRKTNTSGFKGVSAYGNGWVARMRVNNHNIIIGNFATRETAARAYDNAAIQYFGEFARLNFPREVIT